MSEPSERFAHLQPQRLWARELRGGPGRGQSRPLYVQCEDEHGAKVDVVLKLRNPLIPQSKPWALCLVRDLVGAILARHLGLLVPNYALVEIDDTFMRVASLNVDQRDRIQASKGTNFGSCLIAGHDEDVGGKPDQWEPILAFDALGYNMDRRGANPNVLWDGRELYLIDQGMMAATWTFHEGPVSSETLYGYVAIRLHAGFRAVCGQGLSYELARRWPTEVSSELLGWIRTVVPQEWADTAALDDLFGFLSERHRIAGLQLKELQGVAG